MQIIETSQLSKELFNGPENYFELPEIHAIIFLQLVDNSDLPGDRLKTCYHVGIIFFTESGKPAAYNEENSIAILSSLFGNDIQKLWEHAPTTRSGALSSMHHFYLFLSRPYGFKPIVLDAADQLELVKNHYTKYMVK